MSVHGYTKNYKLIKPDFDADTWHDYEYDNLDTIDAVLSAIYASGDWQGFWKNNTSYKAGSVVIDKDTDTMYKVVSDHTTDGNVTFAEYMFNHPEYYQLWSPNNLAQDWAIKDDGLADNQDYSAKAYAVGGVGTETNNAKYYSEQAGIQAEASAEQAAASASSATASYNSEQLALSHANQAASSAASSLTGAEQSVASAAISQEKAEYAANSVAGLESFVQEKQNEISASLAEAIKASEDAKKYAIEASSVSVGNIFYTSRLDNELNGAVEANGAIYSVGAFTGEQSVPELLRKGSLPSVSMAEYESIVSTYGSCRAWGWDNGDIFRVPTAEKMKRVLVAKKEPSEGSYDWYNLYSDGWLEQGGYIYQAGNTTGVANTTTFPRAFKNNDYSLTMFAGVGNSGWDFANGVGLGTGGAGANERESHTTSTTFTWFNATGVSGAPIFWEAKGYAEIPTEAEYQFQNIETHRAMVQLSTGIKEDATQLKEYKFNNPHFFGESKWTDVDPKNSSWLISNGNFHSGRTYVDYYKWLTDIKSGNKTVDGVSVKSVDDEYTDYDFVINTADETFRLPLLNGEEDLPDWTKAQGITVPYTSKANGYITGYGIGTGDVFYKINNALVGETAGTTSWSSRGNIQLLIKNGDVFSLENGTVGETFFNFIPATGNGSLYFYVGDTVQDASLIKASEALDYLSKLSTVHCVVETFKSGSSWYRVYDDGWVEQGGQIVGSLNTITFLKNFKDTTYNFQASVSDASPTDYALTVASWNNKTQNSVTVYIGYNGTAQTTSPCDWQACGYGA